MLKPKWCRHPYITRNGTARYSTSLTQFFFIFFHLRLLRRLIHPPHPRPNNRTSWMSDRARASRAISRVFTVPILSELKLIWHILQTDLVFIQQAIAHQERSPNARTPSFWSALRGRKTFFVITPARSCSQQLGPRQYFYFFFFLFCSDLTSRYLCIRRAGINETPRWRWKNIKL